MTTSPLTPAGLPRGELRCCELRCAHQVNPFGVAPSRVRLSWLLAGGGSGRAQTGYQVIVARDEPGTGGPRTGPGGGAVVWDSGQVMSSGAADVAYQGSPLASGSRYTWQVRVWDETGTVSDWSEPASFETELDPAAGWRAAWIGLGRAREIAHPPTETGPPDQLLRSLAPAPYLRRVFTVGQPVASARLHATALGLYEARLNGSRVGDAVLAPGWTDYARRVLYQTYDVTELLRPGENVLGALLGDGWYCGFFGFDAKRAGAHYGTAPEFLAQLVIELADGSRQWVVTDGGWHASYGAIRHADLLMGERHDLTLEPHGWDAPGFDAAGWQAVRCRDRDGRLLAADPGPPVRVTQEVAPASVSRDGHGRYVVDFGQNLTGWLRVKAGGTGAGTAAGAHVRIRYAEMLAPDGGLYTQNLRTARQTDEFTTADGGETFEPRFTVHGFRYAEISGYPGELTAADLIARVVHSDIEPAGSFESSLPWLNRLFATIDWGQRGNFLSVPTDCPQRDERLGWLGDAQVFARTACYNRDVAGFFAKWLDDVSDAQFPSGAFPDVAPRLNLDRPGAPAWGDAGVIIPWTLHTMYGDTGVLRRHFGAMTAWMDFLERANPGYLRTRELGNNYNDWLAPGEDKTSHELLATAYWAMDAAMMSDIARAIGRTDDDAGYRALRSKIVAAFADAFVAADGQVASGTQTAYVLALHAGLVPDELAQAAAGHLVAAIRAEDWRLTTGFAGVGYLLPVLSSHGYISVAYWLLSQRSRPSWRYMIDHGATTIWERWDGWTDEHGFASPWMNSFNHYALGSVGEWFYRFVLGIEPEPGVAGFGRLLLRPHPGGQLGWARGSYRSVRGLVSAGWEKADGRFSFRAQLPPNVTASVRIPSDDAAQVRDAGGNPPSAIADFPGAFGVREAVFEVGSGSHEFHGPAMTPRMTD
ncbi:MAG TPA: family 78 glycoside hydrolase catalytic domain [Streptosporangiaceae bacterium]